MPFPNYGQADKPGQLPQVPQIPQAPPPPQIDPLRPQQPFGDPGGIAGGIMQLLTTPGIQEALTALMAKAVGAEHPGRASQLVTQYRESGRVERDRRVRQELLRQQSRRQQEQLGISQKRLGLEEERMDLAVSREERQAQQQKQMMGIQTLSIWDKIHPGGNYDIPAALMEEIGFEPVELQVVGRQILNPMEALPDDLKVRYGAEGFPEGPMGWDQYISWLSALRQYGGYGGADRPTAFMKNWDDAYEKAKVILGPEANEQQLHEYTMGVLQGGADTAYRKGITGQRLATSQLNAEVGLLETQSQTASAIGRTITSVKDWEQGLYLGTKGKDAYKMQSTMERILGDLESLQESVMGGVSADQPAPAAGTVTVPELVTPPAQVQQPEGPYGPPIPEGMGPMGGEARQEKDTGLDRMIAQGFPSYPGEDVKEPFASYLRVNKVQVPMVMAVLPDGREVPAYDFEHRGLILIILNEAEPTRYKMAPYGTTTKPATAGQ